MSSDDAKVKSVAKLMLAKFEEEGYTSVSRDDDGEPYFDFVEIDVVCNLEDVAKAIIEEVLRKEEA